MWVCGGLHERSRTPTKDPISTSNSGEFWIDCQVHNPHLETMGAELVSRQVFEKHLEGAIKAPMNAVLTNPTCLAPATKASLEERLLVPLKRFAAELL